jgi:predicted dehydrogenase
VIGAGYMAQIHFDAFQALKHPVRIIADVNADAARPAAGRFGADATGDWRKVVDDPAVKVVAVFTSSATHFPIAKAALDAGKHVISEKTLTLSADESYQLGRLAEEKNLILYTSYMKRFFPAVQTAKRLMTEIGPVMSVYVRTYQGVGCDMHTGEVLSFFRPDASGVSPIVAKSGGGILVCGGSHVFDLLLYLVGKPTGVYARQFKRPGHDADFMTHALFDLSNGGAAHFEGNWHPYKKIGQDRNGWDESIEINGVNGKLLLSTPEWNKFDRYAARLAHYDNAAERWTDYCFDIANPFLEAERHFLGQIAKNEQGEHDRYAGYRTDHLLAMTQKSADAQQRLVIDWKA